MPVFEITSPEGKKYRVTAPDGATREDAIARVQSGSVQPSEPQPFSVTEMVKNIPSSGKQYLGDIYSAISSPIDTAAALGNVAGGGAMLAGDFLREQLPESVQSSIASMNQDSQVQSMPTTPAGAVAGIPGALFSVVNEALKGAPDPRDSARQVGTAMSGRYGSFDAAKQTLMNDPVGAVADMSGLLTGGGALMSRAPGIVGRAGQAVQKAGIATDPINAAVVAPVKAAKQGLLNMLPETLPRDMYMSSAKFPTTLENRADIADTALREGILPTAAGVGKFNAIKKGLISEIDSLIAKATETGVRIPKSAIYRYLNQARDSVGGPRVRAKKNLNQIDDVAREFDTYMDDIGVNSLSPDDLQKFKQSVYKEAKYDAKTLRSGVGTDAAMKQLGRAAKESIESVADVGPLNERLGGLLALEDPLMRSTGRIENLNLGGIGAPIKIAAGQAVGGPVGAGLATGAAILDMPKIKARLAVALKRAQEGGQISAFDQSLIRTLAQQGLLQGGRLVE